MGILLMKIVDAVFGIIELAILIECIASWIPQLRYSSYMDIIYKITNPILEPFRALQNRFIQGAFIDFSPIIAIFVLGFIRNLLVKILWLIF